MTDTVDTPESVRNAAYDVAESDSEIMHYQLRAVVEAMLTRYAALLEQVVDVADYPDGSSHGITLGELIEKHQSESDFCR